MSAAGWFVVLLALALANLPFITQRWFALLRPPAALPGFGGGVKSGWWRLFELIALYFVVGAFGVALEARAGNVFEQGWQFYAITFCLFVVLAFPGFTFRYLIRRRSS